MLLKHISLFLLTNLGLSAASSLPPRSAQLQEPLTSPLGDASSKELLSLHRQLVEIESISGFEADVAKWLASYLKSKNFTVETQRVGHKRWNLLAYPGEERYTPVLVTSHIDTV